MDEHKDVLTEEVSPKLFAPNREKEPPDFELEVIEHILIAMERLDPLARPRVMHYLNDRYASEGL